MLSRTMKAMRRRLGPVGLSLAAASLTAVAFAAVSVAQDDGGTNGDKNGDRNGEDKGATVFEHRVGPPELSEEDQKAMEEFRSCMEENGAPAPPDPEEIRKRFEDGERPDPPEPPSEADREKIEKALEACADKLPEGAGFGLQVGPGGPCGPPPGARGDDDTAIPAPPPGAGFREDGDSAQQGASS